MERIVKYSKLEESTLIISLVYIDRLCDFTGLLLGDMNIHRQGGFNFRVVLASIVLAIKYNEDDYYSNDYYAKVGGISLAEINCLEFELLKLLNHKLFVEEEAHKKYETYLTQYQR
jgi:hypothetical protein